MPALLKTLADALEKKKLTGWQVHETRQRSFQSFLAQEERECARTVQTTKYSVSIYQRRKDGPGGETLGMSSFKTGPADGATLEKKIEDALLAASLVANQPFELPEAPRSIPKVALADAQVEVGSLKDFEDRLRAAVRKEKNIRLSSAEFFANRIHTHLINHRGLDLEQAETVLHTEFILLAKSEERENEFINRYARRFIRDFDLEGEVRESARFAREATLATPPATGNFPVVLSGEPLDHLFKPLIARASARLKYNKMIETDIGKNAIADGEVKGDRIDLWSNGLVDRALGSHAFDSYGTPTQRVQIIKANRVENYLADARYADYLKVPVTGELCNIEVREGKTHFKDMLDPSHSGAAVLYHLQAFSAFEPNAITGAYSAEIRAGYEISKKGIRPIKGGSVSGVLQNDLLDCRLSLEREQRENALVPRGVFFGALTMAGI